MGSLVSGQALVFVVVVVTVWRLLTAWMVFVMKLLHLAALLASLEGTVLRARLATFGAILLVQFDWRVSWRKLRRVIAMRLKLGGGDPKASQERVRQARNTHKGVPRVVFDRPYLPSSQLANTRCQQDLHRCQ